MANIIDINGKTEGSIELPAQFFEPIRPDLVRRAYHALASTRYQPKGNYPLAGLQTSAAYFGRRHEWRQTINSGRSRLPREKLPGGRLGQVRIVPHSVKGRRAHPPKPYKILVERINFKENNKAIRSAIAATASEAAVRQRGHKFSAKLPIIVDNALEAIKKAGDARKTIETLGLGDDLSRAREGRRMRSGRSRARKGGFRTPKSVLIVYGHDSGVWRATRNIPGVDTVSVEKLDAEMLAPGGVAGRLTVWTKDAIEALSSKRLYI